MLRAVDVPPGAALACAFTGLAGARAPGAPGGRYGAAPPGSVAWASAATNGGADTAPEKAARW
jgi:hypothetical protein